MITTEKYTGAIEVPVPLVQGGSMNTRLLLMSFKGE